MFATAGRRIVFGGFRGVRQRYFSNENPKRSTYNFFDDRALGLLTLLVSVPVVNNQFLKLYVGLNLLYIGSLHLEASQIPIQSFNFKRCKRAE